MAQATRSRPQGSLSEARRTARTAILRVIACAGALLVGSAGAAEASSPRELIADASERLLTALVVSGDDLRENPRIAWELANETVLPYVDFDQVGRRVLGKHWRKATPDQRSAYQSAFRDYAANFLVTAMVTYSQEMVDYADRITFPAAHWRPGDERATVRMHVRLAGGVTAEVQYRMHVVDGTWRVFDVTLEGVSMVLMYRQAFAEEIGQHGMDGFIERLAEHKSKRPS